MARSALADAAQRQPAVEIGRAEVGIEPDRLIVVGDGAIVVALGVMGGGAAHEARRAPRIEPDRLIEARDGAVEVAPGELRVAAVEIGAGMVRD